MTQPNFPLNKYVSKLDIHLGQVTVSGALYPIRKSKGKGSGYVKPQLVSPAGNPVKQYYKDEATGEFWLPGECNKGVVKDDDSVVVLDTELLQEAKASELPKNVMVLSVHDQAEVEGQLFPSDNNAYILYPDSDNPINAKWGEFITAAVSGSEGELAFLGMINLKNHEGLFRLTTWRGHLVVQKQLYPDELNPHEPLALDIPAKTADKAIAVAHKMKTVFEPGAYRDESQDRIALLAEETAAGKRPTAATKTKAATPDFDLDAALDDLLENIDG
jgi:non-homologous end joining protein Ku